MMQGNRTGAHNSRSNILQYVHSCEQEQTRRSMHVERTSVEGSWSLCGSGRAIIIACSECVFVALGIQHAVRAILSSVARLCSVFPTLSQ